MANTWVYDVECSSNLFMLAAVPLDTPKKYIDLYKKIDIKLHKLSINPDDNLEAVSKCIADKKKLLDAINAKLFVIWRGWKGHGEEGFIDDRAILCDFLYNHKTMYGYNSYNYDAIMLDIFLSHVKLFDREGFDRDNKHITTFMFEHSDQCISFGNGYRRLVPRLKYHKRPFRDLDIQKILYLDKSMTGLKKVGINLRYYRLQELPFKVGEYIPRKSIPMVGDYNFNDVFITLLLILDQKDELEIRESGSIEFGLKLHNMSRSSIGKNLMTKFYSELSGLEPKDFVDLRTNRYAIKVSSLIDMKIGFKTPQFQKLFNDIKKSTIFITDDKDKSKWDFGLVYNGTKYIVAKGGLHSKDDPRVFDVSNDPDEIIRDADVTSYYPSIIINLNICPKHLVPKYFITILKYIMRSRVEAKHKAKEFKDSDPVASDKFKKKSDIYKIVINRIYGALKDINDYLYDPACTYKTTINGQLYLLMLVERLELEGIHVISANTDGIVAKFHKSQEATYNRICKAWEEELKFELEYTNYEKYIRNSVNEYIAIKEGFYADYKELRDKGEWNDISRKEKEKYYVKFKGMFIANPDFSKGFTYPVVSKALINYYIYNVPINNTLTFYASNAETIYDFCITQKVGKTFAVEYHTTKGGIHKVETLQQYNRFYISKNPVGIILKRKGKKLSSIIAKENTALLNFYDYTIPTDIKFSFYGKKCMEIIQGTKKKGKGGKYGISTMFLELDYEDDFTPEIEDNYSDYSYLYEDDEL